MGRAAPNGKHPSLANELEVLRLDESRPLRDVLPLIRKALSVDAIAFVRPIEHMGGWTAGAIELDGFATPTKARKLISELVEMMLDVRHALFPNGPPPAHHDAMFDVIGLVGRDRYVRSPLYTRFVVPLGLEKHHLACLPFYDHEAMLGWLAAFSRDAIDAQTRRAFDELVPAIRQRLRLANAVSTAPRIHAALAVTLEQLGAPALLVDSRGRIFETNSAARALVEARRDELVDSIRSVLANQPASLPLMLTRISDGTTSELYLAVLRPRTPKARLALAVSLAAHRWKLTRRQTEVLQLIARGETNGGIASTLGITERATELHITAIFDRARVSNRAALVAAVLLG